MQPSPTGKEQRTYAQPCKKYTSGAHTSRQAAVGKNGVAPPPPPPSSQGADSPSFNIGNLQAGNAVKAPGKLQQRHANGDVPHRCPHEHIVSLNGRRENHDDHGNLSSCASAMANCAGNVSVGTSTLCQDPDCHSHHDDNCDSIDDSGSEKSSSTSTSNQKEGKFCDCYYCEFLGHGNTQMTQTSKNLAEIRERLRKRLKQKNEAAAKQEHGGCHELQVANHKAISQKVNTKNLDELLSFINGTDSDGAKAGSQPSSSKAAKKARQKQRKLDEKIRKEEEERRQKQAQEAAEEAAKALAASKSNNNQKKKGKHKEQQKQQHKPASSSTTASNNPSPAPKPDATLRESTGKGKATEVEEKAVNNSNSHQVDKSKPSTPQAPTAVPSTKVSSVPAKVDSAPQPATVTAGLKHTADTPAASVASPANPPRLLTKANLKSAEVFQPPAHLMRSLAEQTMQQQQQATSAVAGTTNTAVPSTSIFNTSPTGLPTLGNQPNSPTAKKAKRRLGPAGSAGQLTAQRKLLINTPISAPEGTQLVEAQRRLEAQQDVAKQMKEAHEYAQQQSQLRQQFIQQQQQAQSQQQTVSSQPQPQDPKKPSNAPSACQADFQQQLLKMQQLKQQHLKQQQQKVLAQKQGPVPRQAAPASSTGKQHSPAPAPNQQQQPHVKVSANGVAGHHVALSNNHHSKVAVAEVGRAASSQNAAPANAVNWSQSGHKTQLQDTNGLATLLLGPGVHEMPQRRAVSQQEIIDAGARNARGKNKKKKKANQDTRAVDEVFMPNPDAELDSNDMDEADRDIEKFKRFVMENPTPPKERKKLDVTLNMKDIFSKKKSGLGCA